ncbi:hypothetical protein C7C46_22600 [Streptomyces tateyamensis]|uniref:Chaplin domain-containing protein n=1 Tax=Streptomyces tateyamensis TaxID=565073 RepID=A0A2V4MXU0_9ACTN|nr:hypothetical protein [Streptomyces tateyamensis]PYC76271.1 hypothetical protein C7C46_22600 [Streptomyces tateyamensis]
MLKRIAQAAAIATLAVGAVVIPAGAAMATPIHSLAHSVQSYGHQQDCDENGNDEGRHEEHGGGDQWQNNNNDYGHHNVFVNSFNGNHEGGDRYGRGFGLLSFLL